MRLQKYLAQSGVASRRAAEKLIAEGHVAVNGEIRTQMGIEVGEEDTVAVDGRPVHQETRLRYILLNKPQGVVSTVSDPEGRTTVRDLIPEIPERIFPVGRLDYDTEGLLILTNDGELMQNLTHPTKGVEKVYLASVAGPLSEDKLQRIASGILLDDGYQSAPCSVRVVSAGGGITTCEVTVTEGHNRIVRRLFQAVDCRVSHLKRIRLGPIQLGHLKSGQWRHLTENEIKALQLLG